MFIAEALSTGSLFSLTILELMQEEIMNCDNYGDFYIVMENFPKTIDRATLLKNLITTIHYKQIKQLRL